MVNDALTDLTGYDRATLLDSHVSKLLNVEDIVRAETAIRDQLIDGATESLCITVPVFTAISDSVPCEICATVVTVDGEFRGTAGVICEVDDPETVA